MPQSTGRHTQLIESVVNSRLPDSDVRAALMFGSFPKGEADAYSDAECCVFVADDGRDVIVFVGEMPGAKPVEAPRSVFEDPLLKPGAKIFPGRTRLMNCRR